MGQKLTVGFKDINGANSSTNFWVNDALNAVGAIQNLANLSNAAIISAGMVEVLDISGLGLKAAALAANVETARTKIKAHFSGADAGSVAKPRADVTLSVPAPVGALIGPGGATPADWAALIPLIRSASDVAMDRLDRAYFSKSR